MQTILSTITSKGQITIPAEIRRRLGVGQGDKVAFVIDEDGTIELQVPKFPTVRSLQGQLATLPREMEYAELREIAYEDRLASKYERRG